MNPHLLISNEIRRRQSDLESLAGTPAAAIIEREIAALQASAEQIRKRDEDAAEARAAAARKAELVSNPMSGARLAQATGERATELLRAILPAVEADIRGPLAGSLTGAFEDAVRTAYQRERATLPALSLATERLLPRWRDDAVVVDIDFDPATVAEASPASIGAFIVERGSLATGGNWPMYVSAIRQSKQQMFDLIHSGERLDRPFSLYGAALAHAEAAAMAAAIKAATWATTAGTGASVTGAHLADLIEAGVGRWPVEAILASRSTIVRALANGARFSDAGIRLVALDGLADDEAYALGAPQLARTVEVHRPAASPRPSVDIRSSGFIAALTHLIDHSFAFRVKEDSGAVVGGRKLAVA